MRKKCLPFLWAICLGFSLNACEFAQLTQIDFANSFFNTSCGKAEYAGHTVEERCGRIWGASGYQFLKDQIILLHFGSDQAQDSFVATSALWFDSRYFKADQTVPSEQIRATCSRYKLEIDPADRTYYTVPAESFSIQVLEQISEQKEKGIVETSDWKVKWSVQCPALDMAFEGEDVLRLDNDPPWSDWKGSGKPRPPEYSGD